MWFLGWTVNWLAGLSVSKHLLHIPLTLLEIDRIEA